jgi:magnesium-transporting ATPase (P-type)
MSSKRFSLLNQVEKTDQDNNVSVEGNVSINRIASTFSPLSIHGVNDKNPLMDSMNVDDDEDTEDKRVLKMLNLINTDENESNLTSLNSFGGVRGVIKALDVDVNNGLNELQVDDKRKKFGANSFAVAPLVPYYTLVLETMNDASLLILLLAATFSLIVGIYRHGFHHGWIEGSAIFIAVFVVTNITAMNNYTKQLQFKKIEEIATNDFTCNVIRNGIYFNINPKDLVVGDIVSLQVGDAIPADCILLDGSTCKSNESTLTGEADDVSKGKSNPFLLSSCTVTAGNTSGNIKAMVIAVGARSKWGKIKDGITNGITTDVLTPLQLKLQELTKLIGNIGMFFSVATFIAYVLNHADLMSMRSENGVAIIEHVIDGFILAVTILVVAIPEGLPLAVTISLAWSTQKMYKDKCFIRVLASCEVMGNATNICSDKTGTLTENKMTVVEGYFGDKMYVNLNESNAFSPISKHHISVLDIATKTRVIENMAVNRTAYYIRGNNKKLIGSKTEGALIDLINRWGFDEEDIKKQVFSEERGDKLFPFCSEKKLSSCLLQYTSTHQRTYIKGASEWILKKCTHFTNDFGIPTELTPSKRAAIERFITNMANASLRTIALAYNDTKMLTYAGADEVDIESYVLDAVIGIIDPLREGVIESVKTAQEAGICVRMVSHYSLIFTYSSTYLLLQVTGDNIHTAMAIAKQAGILHEDGILLTTTTINSNILTITTFL